MELVPCFGDAELRYRGCLSAAESSQNISGGARSIPPGQFCRAPWAPGDRAVKPNPGSDIEPVL